MRKIALISEHASPLALIGGVDSGGQNADVARYAMACDCSKPMPGMLTRAAEQHGIDPGRSWMIGDILNDVEAGRRAGCRTILIDNGNETEWHWSLLRSPDMILGDLRAAARAAVLADFHMKPETREALPS